MRNKAKILMSILLAVLLCVCICACQKAESKDVTTSDTVLKETAAAENTTAAKPVESTQQTNEAAQQETTVAVETETTRPAYLAEQTTAPAYLAEQTTTSADGAEQTTTAKSQEETTTAFGNGAPVEDVTEELQRDRELQLLLQLSDPVDYNSSREVLCMERLQSICSGEIALLYSPEKPYSVEAQTIKNEADTVTVSTPEESLEWLAENIYNIKSDVIKKFNKDCSASLGVTISSEKGGGTITFKDGAYICVRPAASKPVYYCSVVSAQKSKDTYQVRYMLAGYESSKKIYCTAILKQNEAEGQKYWSVLSVSRETES